MEIKGRYDEYDNVYDFNEFYMLRLCERLANAGNEDLANVILNTLNAYLTGDIDVIGYANGVPICVKVEAE